MQAAYHPACEFIFTQTEGLDLSSATVFTRPLVEISMYQKNFHNGIGEISVPEPPACNAQTVTSMKKGALWPFHLNGRHAELPMNFLMAAPAHFPFLSGG